MVCKKCGNSIKSDFKFCPYCGERTVSDFHDHYGELTPPPVILDGEEDAAAFYAPAPEETPPDFGRPSRTPRERPLRDFDDEIPAPPEEPPRRAHGEPLEPPYTVRVDPAGRDYYVFRPERLEDGPAQTPERAFAEPAEPADGGGRASPAWEAARAPFDGPEDDGYIPLCQEPRRSPPSAVSPAAEKGRGPGLALRLALCLLTLTLAAGASWLLYRTFCGPEPFQNLDFSAMFAAFYWL